ncbi:MULTISPECIES: benzaldehyde dehydrogenase [Hyphomicrobiales]|uniref:Benzaldehyde dehydrogenase (NAD+) n=2 Tax=Hyphomicrobiales TaxID=356 RepID=A0A285V2Q5_9HYPH|nr:MULTISPECIES: benzaldehyde dehydrogenase [Hyphomicrobiales]KAB0564641.1 aldehyde dehydrogenase family protein [Brucella pituitosa]SOC48382.1 benzaldehyde dehydrogenase (NAD+) [Rhizobium subbaraonis]
MKINRGNLLPEQLWEADTWTNGLPSSSSPIKVHEPATGEVLARIAQAGPSDVIRAVEAAAAVQSTWARTSAIERAAVMRRAADILSANAAEYAEWLVRESGSASAKVRIELAAGAAFLQKAASTVLDPQGYVFPQIPGRTSIGRRVPHGVIGIISPFNFPLILSIRSLAPALAVGNAVLLKPDPRTPFSGGVLLARILEMAGLPEKLLQILPGGGDVGQAMCEAEGISMISFTGSTSAGRKVGEVCGRMLKKAQLELGGKNPLMILEDADLDLAVESAIWGSYLHQGQICMATGKILVAAPLVKHFTEKFVEKAGTLKWGDPTDSGVAIGPLIDASQRDRVHGIVQRSVQEGAELLLGGEFEGLFYKPTVLANVRPDMAAYREEVFGPVASIIPFSTEEEALRLACDTEYGLSAGIISRDIGRAMRLGEELEVGMLHINDQTVADEPFITFGGRKASGNGQTIGGPVNLDAYCEWQWLTIREHPHPHKF